MNKADLVEALAKHFDGDRTEAARALDAVLEIVTYEIAAGGRVAVAGFGTFETVTRPPRVTRDPRTGRQRRAKATPVPQFRAAAELRAYASGAKKAPQAHDRVVARRSANAAARRLLRDSATDELTRHILDFDPRQPSSYLFAASPGSPQAAELAAAAQPDLLPWPAGLEPRPVRHSPKPTTTAPLPQADVLVVTYTAAESHALADVLAPGWDTARWHRYRNGWQALKKSVRDGAPSKVRDQAGLWAATRVGATSVVLVKSDLHPPTDGGQLPLRALWWQMIKQVQPRLVITTGSAGAVGSDVLLGDVVVSRHVRWGDTLRFSDQPWARDSYTSPASLQGSRFTTASRTLLPVVAEHLPPAARPPKIWTDTRSHPAAAISTDFFAFGDARDHSGLHALEPTSRVVEMHDAALALACADLADPPAWVSVRNASIHRLEAPTFAAERRQAASAYERYSYWSSVGSAIACWALIAKPVAGELEGSAETGAAGPA